MYHHNYFFFYLPLMASVIISPSFHNKSTCVYRGIGYLDGEGVQVIEHHMVGLWKQRRVTLMRIEREGEFYYVPAVGTGL